jgi:hypothetical protein
MEMRMHDSLTAADPALEPKLNEPIVRVDSRAHGFGTAGTEILRQRDRVAEGVENVSH